MVVHVGEGLTFQDYEEINQLIKWNILKKKLVGIHAVAMTDEQARKFEAIVWCPESNYFLLSKTAPVNLLKQHTNILFGSDSTLTGIAPVKELAVTLRAQMELPHLPSTSLPYLRDRDIPLTREGKKVLAYAVLEADRGWRPRHGSFR